MELYERMLRELGPEFSILRDVPTEDLEAVAGPCVSEGIRRLRLGQVERRAGYDGGYGTISLLTPGEIERFNGQLSLFTPEGPSKAAKRKPALKQKASVSPGSAVSAAEDALNPQQQQAVTAREQAVAVIAGPGTGKTKTLVEHIAYLVDALGVKSGEITAVTFTNQAAAEMRTRLEQRLGGKRAVSGIPSAPSTPSAGSCWGMSASSVRQRLLPRRNRSSAPPDGRGVLGLCFRACPG